MDEASTREPASVEAELAAREPVFHRTVDGTSRSELEQWVAADFWEVGASGRVYDRETMLTEVVGRYADPGYDAMAGVVVDQLACRPIGPATWLVTYRLVQDARETRRSTVWLRVGGRWVVQYHQGTVVS